MTIKKPMKGDDFVESELKFPYFASFKLDGFRAFVEDGTLLTSSGKPVSNAYCQALFGHERFNGLDGELVVGAWNDPRAFPNTSGPVRRASGEPDVRWYIFDDRTVHSQTYLSRFHALRHRVSVEQSRHTHVAKARIEVIPQTLVHTAEELASFESYAIRSGFEGVMIRQPEGLYKFGRSTVKENLLLKVKRFINEEATIIGFTEQLRNTSESHENDLGRLVKSENKADMVGTGMVGSFVVRSEKWGCDFSIAATSLSLDERKEAFEQFDAMYKGQLARFKYFPHGVVDRPRHAVFEAIRGKEDMTE